MKTLHIDLRVAVPEDTDPARLFHMIQQLIEDSFEFNGSIIAGAVAPVNYSEVK